MPRFILVQRLAPRRANIEWYTRPMPIRRPTISVGIPTTYLSFRQGLSRWGND